MLGGFPKFIRGVSEIHHSSHDLKFVDSVVYNMLKAMTYMDEKDLSTFHGGDTGKNFHCRFVWIEDLINTDDSI